MTEWARSGEQPLIPGHTHLPIFPQSHQTPYFNTGCGVNLGYITGIELENGFIYPVKWFDAGAGYYGREQLAPARSLEQINS